MTPGAFVRARLHRRIFVWFGATIVVTAFVVGAVMMALGHGEGTGWKAEAMRLQSFTAGRFERVWDVPADRGELARAIARDLDVDVRILDASGAIVSTDGGACRERPWRVPIVRAGLPLGTVELCAERHHPYAIGPRVLIALFLAGTLLWIASGRIARRLSSPIVEVARVAEEIGSGMHHSRVRLGRRRQHGEVAALAVAINTMAERIEKQFRDQRELLAAVSHEIRTPLARIRLLLELARDNGIEERLEKSFAEIDREVVEMDALVSELLASSRVDFAALTRKKLDAHDVARRALERASVTATALAMEPDGASDAAFHADATLMARALANLIENAERHGSGLSALRVRIGATTVAFEAEDGGPGFAAGEGERAFEPFYRGGGAKDGERPSLGLGLALVRRIAEAHGGRAYMRAREGGGAVVGIELPR